MRRILSSFVIGAMLVGALAAPAAASGLDIVDIGVVLQATATVSKNAINSTAKFDRNCADGTGGGIGLPVLNDPKFAFYEFEATDNGGTSIPLILSALHGRGGFIHVCGVLKPVLYDETNGAIPIGAACGGSSSNEGTGYAELSDGSEVQFEEVGWDASAGSVFVATGRATDTATKKKSGGLIALVSARGTGTQCTNKAGNEPNKTGGAGTFQVDFVYVVGSAVPAIIHHKGNH